jgi:hypothetical protein
LRDIWRPAIGFVAVALLLAGVLTRSWWVVRSDEHRSFIGMTSAEVCDDEQCSVYAYGDVLPERDRFWVHAGRTTFGLSCASGLFLAVASLLSLLRRRLPGPLSPARIAAVLSATTGFASAYVFFNPMQELPPEALVSFGFPLVALGAVLGIVAGVVLDIERRDMGHREFTGLPVPGVRRPGGAVCAKCQGPLRFVDQYARHFCDRCRYYV